MSSDAATSAVFSRLSKGGGMAGQALYRKWRSQTFEDVVGQEHVTLTLRNALRDGRLSHAYLFTGPRGTGKCVKFDTLVLDPVTGALETIETLCRRQQASLLTLDPDYKFQPVAPTDFVDDGVKSCYKVTTALGREIETTLTHPFLTILGWKCIGELRAGDRIGVPRYLPVQGGNELPLHQVRLIAYFLAEGSTSNPRKIGFTNSDPAIVADFVTAVEEFDNVRIARFDGGGKRAPTYWIYQRQLQNHLNKPGQVRNSAIEFALQFGLMDKTAAEKAIPAAIFRLSTVPLRHFLQALFSCDGGVDWTRRTPRIHYSSTSPTLIRQIQHLLLRFGIIARIRYKPTKYKSEYRPAWVLEITNRESMDRYVAEIGFIGAKAQKLQQLADRWQSRISNPNRDVIPAEVYELVCVEKAKSDKTWVDVGRALGDKKPKKAAPRFLYSPSRAKLRVFGKVLESREICNLAESDLYWDEIVSIEYTGDFRVYDLTVPETHSFVANDFVVHNTSTARVLAKAINCLEETPAARPCNHCRVCTAITEGRLLDLIEIDAASNRGIDEIRDLREKIGFRPNEARYKIYIIDEVHMLTKEAFNALLKTLEEPPPHAIFILATTEPDRVPETVRSRCQRFDFRRIPTAEIVEHLNTVVQSEGGRAAPEALVAIARRSTGSMRDAISLLDQLLSYGDEVLGLARVEGVLGLVSPQTIGLLVDAIASADAAAGLELINRLVAEGVELGQLVDQIVAYLRGVMFVRLVRAPDLLDLPQDILESVERQAEALTPARLLSALHAFIEARSALRDQVPGVPQLPIEMAFLRAVLPAGPQQTGVVAERARPVQSAFTDRPSASSTGTPAAPPPPMVDRPSGQADVAPTARPSPPLSEPDADLLGAAQTGWDRVLAAAGKRCGMKVQAALRSVKGIDVVGQTIVLQFAHAFARDLVTEGANRSQVESLWEEQLQRKVQIRCALVGEAPAPSAGPPQNVARLENDDEALLRGAQELGAVVTRLS